MNTKARYNKFKFKYKLQQKWVWFCRSILSEKLFQFRDKATSIEKSHLNCCVDYLVGLFNRKKNKSAAPFVINILFKTQLTKNSENETFPWLRINLKNKVISETGDWTKFFISSWLFDSTSTAGINASEKYGQLMLQPRTLDKSLLT